MASEAEKKINSSFDLSSSGENSSENPPNDAQNSPKSQKTADRAEEKNSDFEAAQQRIQELEKQLNEEKNRYLYLYSDFENQRRRAAKEQLEARKFGWEPAARDLLEVIDNIERALNHVPASTDKALVDGLHMVLNQFRATLDKHGVKVVPALDQEFDPNFHEAVAHEPSDKPQGTIVEEQLRGYLLHDRLLRASRVVVSAGPAKEAGKA